jgi:NADH:ubiquinone oxidoreductase subunit 3 (subunit A)
LARADPDRKERTVDQFLAPLLMLAVGIGGVGAVSAAHRLTAGSSGPLRAEAFLSGGVASEHALSRFHVRWYVLTLVFLAFDVEMLFMYPWALVVADVGLAAVVEMFVFLALLLAGVLYAWREGALRWA